jgi:carbon monoxide dehydrogenase subunit G
MEMKGEQIIPLPQQTVWEGLNDPAVLKDCIMGCESLDKVAYNEYKVAMTAAIGPVKAKFTGKLLLADVNAPHSYSLAFEGSGGAAGFGKGTAQVSLSPEGGGTRLSYSAKASVGGKLAQIGSRLIDGVAKKMTDDFFAKFSARVAPPAAAGSSAGAVSSAQADAEAGKSTAFNPIWVVFLTLLLMLVVNAIVVAPK